MPRSFRILAIAVLLAASMIGYYFGILIPQVRSVHTARRPGTGLYFGNDFFPIWIATHALAQHPCNPYSDALTRQVEVGLYGRPLVPALPGDPPRQYRGFSYPLYVELFVWPLARLSFEQTQYVLTALFVPLMALGGLLWLRVIGVSPGPVWVITYLLFYLTSYPALEAILALQPSIPLACCLAAMSFALVRGRYFVAGILLALASIKPQLTVLLTAWLLAWSLIDWKQRKGFVLGFGLTFGSLLVASEWILPGWISIFVRTLALYRQFTVPPLVRFFFGPVMGTATAVLLLALAVYACWRTSNSSPPRSDFLLALAIVLAVTIAIFPTALAVYDHLLLVPGLLWVYNNRAIISNGRIAPRWLLGLLAATLLWQWIAAFVVTLLVSFFPGLRSNEKLALLPLRLAASIPFITIAVLGLMAVRTRDTNPRPAGAAMPIPG